MAANPDYEDTEPFLEQLFPESNDGKSDTYIQNDYFIKNKDKYIPSESEQLHRHSLKLPYFDSFLTRYVYYSFTRWLNRVGLFLGVNQ